MSIICMKDGDKDQEIEDNGWEKTTILPRWSQ